MARVLAAAGHSCRRASLPPGLGATGPHRTAPNRWEQLGAALPDVQPGRVVHGAATLARGIALAQRPVKKFLRPRHGNLQGQSMVALLFTQAAAKDGNVRGVLLSETKAFVLNGISSGAFAGRKPTGATAQGLLAPLFADASTGRKEIRSVGQARTDGNAWLVPFVVHDGGNGESYDVTGRVTKVDGQMRLTSVSNMETLLRRVAAESRAVEP